MHSSETNIKKQKVISINVLTRTEGNTSSFKELEFPTLSKYLEDGYMVKEVHQIAPSQNLYVITLTFILEKTE